MKNINNNKQQKYSILYCFPRVYHSQVCVKNFTSFTWSQMSFHHSQCLALRAVTQPSEYAWKTRAKKNTVCFYSNIHGHSWMTRAHENTNVTRWFEYDNLKVYYKSEFLSLSIIQSDVSFYYWTIIKSLKNYDNTRIVRREFFN